MLTETALVLNVRGDKALVQAQRNEACHSCAASGACHALGGGKDTRIEVVNTVRAGAGDRVELSLPEASFLRASAVTYGIPLVCLIAGALLGQVLAGAAGISANAGSIICAALGVGGSLPVVAGLNRKLSADTRYTPTITRILPPLAEDASPVQPGEQDCSRTMPEA